MQFQVITSQEEGNTKRISSNTRIMRYSSSVPLMMSYLLTLFFVSTFISSGNAANSRFGEYCLGLITKQINCSEPIATCVNYTSSTYGVCQCPKEYYTLQLADASGRYMKTDCLKVRASKDDPCENSLQCQYNDPGSVCVTGNNKKTCKCREIEGYYMNTDTGLCVAPPTPNEGLTATQIISTIGWTIMGIGGFIFVAFYAYKGLILPCIQECAARRRASRYAQNSPSNTGAAEDIPLTQMIRSTASTSTAPKELNEGISRAMEQGTSRVKADVEPIPPQHQSTSQQTEESQSISSTQASQEDD